MMGVEGEEAVFESVEADAGFAFGSARSGRFLCVEAVSLDLFQSTHTSFRGSGRVWGWARVGRVSGFGCNERKNNVRVMGRDGLRGFSCPAMRSYARSVPKTVPVCCRWKMRRSEALLR